jgi:aminopeptidase-like protein
VTTSSTTIIDPERIGEEMYGLIRELFPLCRSITAPKLFKDLSMLFIATKLIAAVDCSGRSIKDSNISTHPLRADQTSLIPRSNYELFNCTA